MPSDAGGRAGASAPAAAGVCVLLPVYNDQEGLERTFEVLAADPHPFDIVVVDDGSRTPIQAPERCGSHAVTLLRLTPNRGIEHALNAGLEAILARGYDYIARLDAGDTPILGRFEAQAAYLDAHPEAGIVGSWVQCVDDDGEYLYTLRFPTEHAAILRKQRYVPALLHPAIMMRATALREVGLYSDRYKAAEDYDLFVRIGRRYRLANLPQVLTTYIVSSRGITSSKRNRTLVSRLKIQLRDFSWVDPHAYLGVVRTVTFMAIPFRTLTAAKRLLWR
jgi:glycosyltransferase involved in cell wall biosynthesis